MALEAHLVFRAGAAPAVPEPAPSGRRFGWVPFRDWGWRELLFYVGVPAAIGLYEALNNWTVLQLAGYERTLQFYAAHALIPWWVNALVTYGCWRLLRPWRPHQLAVLMTGSLMTCFVVLPYATWVTQYFSAGWVVPGDPDGALSASHILTNIGFWSFALRATAVWVAINLLFDRFLGLPRYRYDEAQPTETAEPRAGIESVPATEVVPAPATSDDHSLRFLQRLPAAVTADDVIALKAEQHYIKVFTATRNFMTLYRFSDAVGELNAADGLQLHRSYWVRTTAIRSVQRQGRRYSVELSTGLVVPVSLSNRGLIRDLAKARHLPIKTVR